MLRNTKVIIEGMLTFTNIYATWQKLVKTRQNLTKLNKI